MTKLNLGCGANHMEGYINIDIRIPKTKQPDFVCDITRLPYKQETIDEIVSYHSFEHLTLNNAYHGLRLWHKILVKGGKLIIECPDIKELCRRVSEGEYQFINNIYGLGRNEYDFHRYGWTGETLSQILNEVGFKTMIETPTDYHSQDEPSIRVIGIK